MRRGEWPHGRTGYINHGCRCDICRKGNNEGMKMYGRHRKARGICRACVRPVDPGNVTYCALHRERERERQARARLREKAVWGSEAA